MVALRHLLRLLNMNSLGKARNPISGSTSGLCRALAGSAHCCREAQNAMVLWTG